MISSITMQPEAIDLDLGIRAQFTNKTLIIQLGVIADQLDYQD